MIVGIRSWGLGRAEANSPIWRVLGGGSQFLEGYTLVAHHQPEGKLLGREPTGCRSRTSFSDGCSGREEKT